jgi:hypothetical protein
MRETLIKGLLGAAESRCAALRESVAWAGLLRGEKLEMGYTMLGGGHRGAGI